ncbi:MAG: 6,7-dimethyl-8-ribityllumazine synthase [Leptospiraceae bacterium]|nr:6,7-dimethyl-8-ribityllumazine synthase [Leptospiraceae bacterium]MDW7976911.1 6,7-dimethyl-8-ribityllumazine synthase [Leptospiraceae bacterium]
MNVYEGSLLNAPKYKYAIVVSRWNEFITERLKEGALLALRKHGVPEENFDVFYVSGSFELGSTAKKIALTKNYDGILCIGCVIRGATDHYDHVASQAASQIARASMDTNIPIIFTVLTTDTIEQAIERAGTKSGNKGYEGAITLMEMCDLYHKIEKL